MGFCHSRESSVLTQVVEAPSQPHNQMKRQISHNLLELRKIKSVPQLSLCDSPLYRRRKVEMPTTESPCFPVS